MEIFVSKMRRFWTIFLRCIDLILLSIAAGLIYIVFLQQAINVVFNNLVAFNKFYNSWHILFAVVAFLTITLWFIIRQLGGVLLRGFLYNPPIWLCGTISSICLFYLYRYFVKDDKLFDGKILFFSLSVFLLCGFIAWIIKYIFTICENGIRKQKIEHAKDVRSTALSEFSKNPEELFAWLNKEEPISNDSQDCFDMAIFAKRITRILQGYPLKTIGLVGPYGCGKSSILKMAQDYIKNQNVLNDMDKIYSSEQIIICEVSGWGFCEGTAAEHILNYVISELSKYTDCIGLEAVPANYRHAMLGSDNIIAKIVAALLGGWQSPKKVLKKIDTVLYRINKRLIVFLEDIDRNKRTDMFFNEITALLEELKELEHISFVLAIGKEHQGQEVIIKVAEHIEVVPNLPRGHVINTIKTFRTHCLKKLSNKEKCIPDEIRDKRMGINRSELLDVVAGSDKSLRKPIDHIAKLLNNPRVLKTALRRTSQAWNVLCGEIDFDDLFLATVLRAAAPDVFFFINQNIEQIRSLITDRAESKDRSNKSREDLHTEFNTITKEVNYDIEAVESLMHFLFPGWSKNIGSYTFMREPVRKYQRVENSWPTDYWARLAREELIPNEINDQSILKAITEWNKSKNNKAYKNKSMRDAILSEDGVFNKLRQFKELIHIETIQGLAQEQFKKTLDENKNLASLDNCPAVDTWWLLMPEDPSKDTKTWEDWLLQEIYKAIPISLRYVNDLYSTWLRSFPALRDNIIGEAKRVYDGKPDILIEVLDPDTIGSICIFAYYYSLPKQHGSGFNPEEWKWLARVLLDAGEKNPKLIIPQIATLLCEVDRGLKTTDSGEHFESFDGKFLEQRTKDLFSDDFERLMKLLVIEIDISKYDEQKKSYIYAAQQYAHKWNK